MMAEYTGLFDGRIRRVTGTPDQMASALKSLGVCLRKEGAEIAASKIERLLTVQAVVC